MEPSKSVSTVLLFGLVLRLGLAPFTGHPYDMGIFSTSQRLFYQSGILDLKYFPTLPLLYYVQLVFYAPYVLLTIAGMPDFQYYFHTTMMIEGTFLKLPLILSDVGIFLVMLRFTKKLVPATLFFLNPFPIYLSAVWGTYDSLMLFPLVLGMYVLTTNNDTTKSSFSFVISGLMKLFGFLTYALLICESLVRRRFRDQLLPEILGGLALVAGVIAPVFLVGGLQTLVYGVIYRFIGLSSASGAGGRYNLFAVLLKLNPSGALPLIPVGVALICLAFSYESSRAIKQSLSLRLLKWTLVGAVVFNVFSVSEPQWLSWLLPLGITYGSLTERDGLQYFAYVFGVVVTFLTMTLLQGTGYMLIGTGASFLIGYVENIPSNSLLYAVMISTMIAIFCGYLVFKGLRSFRLEIVPSVVLIYLQAYFWIVIVGVGRGY